MIHQTNADYPNVMGMPLVQGRFLTEQEVNAGRHNAVVNQTFVRRYLHRRRRRGPAGPHPATAHSAVAIWPTIRSRSSAW